MGACSFFTYSAGIDPKMAFKAVVEQALYEHGHGGYSGTIAEKSGYTIIERTPLTRDAANELADKKVEDNDKWGNAFAIPIQDKADPAKIGGWLFFGYASE